MLFSGGMNTMSKKQKVQSWMVGIALLLSAVGFVRTPAVGQNRLSGTVKIDGSSTVFPVSEAVAEEFQKVNRGVRVTVGISGTGGGFKKFGAGETDISDASRPIKETEVALCKQNGIQYIELPICYDALTVVVNPQNNWCKTMTVKELKKLWEPEAQGKITHWNQIRPNWPNQPIRLFGAGTDSGTYDYFTEAIVGKEHSSRGDFTGSEDDNVLVQGVARDQYALGFIPLAYVDENPGKLKKVAIDDEKDTNGKGAVLPSAKNVINGTYQPLSRPLFIYVNRKSSDRPEVKAFVNFYLKNAATLSREVGYIPLQSATYQAAQQRFQKRMLGSVFGGHGSQIGVKLEDLLKKEAVSP
jgi:phosphate transport system substrate-binding protein